MNHDHNHDHNKDNNNDIIDQVYQTEYLFKWYGWGSPVGLGIFLISLGALVSLSIILIKIVF